MPTGLAGSVVGQLAGATKGNTGMPAAVAGPAIGSAASSIFGALLGSHGQSQAAKAQAATAQQALDLQKQIYEQGTAQRKPFYDQAVTSLGALGRQAAAGTVQALPGAAGYGRGGNMPSVGAAFSPSQQYVPGPMPGGWWGGGGGMVTVQAPDGETRQFPADVAQKIVGMGGKIVTPGAGQNRPMPPGYNEGGG